MDLEQERINKKVVLVDIFQEGMNANELGPRKVKCFNNGYIPKWNGVRTIKNKQKRCPIFDIFLEGMDLKQERNFILKIAWRYNKMKM